MTKSLLRVFTYTCTLTHTHKEKSLSARPGKIYLAKQDKVERNRKGKGPLPDIQEVGAKRLKMAVLLTK
jgi:hypothetical protein